MAKRTKPFVDNYLATLLRLYADEAQRAIEKHFEAQNRLSKLRLQYVADIQSEIRKCEIEERRALLEIIKLLQKYVPKIERGDDSI